MTVDIRQGDALQVLKSMPSGSAHCCVTSPPYWTLRDYGIQPSVWGGDPGCEHSWDVETVNTEIGRGNWSQAVNGRGEAQGDISEFREPIRATAERGFCRKCGAWKGCLGLEPRLDLYVEHIVTVFCEVFRVLRKDGTLWLNLGDCYTTKPHGNGPTFGTKLVNSCNRASSRRDRAAVIPPVRACGAELKPKDLVGVPWLVAFALRKDGWYLRRDIIWEKPNCMPESCKDRPTTSHEYVFLMSKSARYYYDAEAVKVPASPDTHARYARGRSNSHKYADGGPGKQTIAKRFDHMVHHPGVNPKSMAVPTGRDTGPGAHNKRVGRYKQNPSFSAAVKDVVEERNLRSIWRIPSKGFSGAHFATFPPKLVEPCILAGCPTGGTVLDPFGGSGTVGMVAEKNGRNSILIELNPKYIEMARRRTAQAGLFCAGNQE